MTYYKNSERIVNHINKYWKQFNKKVVEYYKKDYENEKYLWHEFSKCSKWLSNKRKVFNNLNLINSYYGAGIVGGKQGVGNYTEVHKIFRILISNITENGKSITSNEYRHENMYGLVDKLCKAKIVDKEVNMRVAIIKFLHFCQPKYFPIFDTKVCIAIEKRAFGNKTYNIGRRKNKDNGNISYETRSKMFKIHRDLLRIVCGDQKTRKRFNKLKKDLKDKYKLNRLSDYTLIDKLIWLNNKKFTKIRKCRQRNN